MSDEKKKIGDCTVGCTEDVFHLLILVAGTTDPVNTLTDAKDRATSYKPAIVDGKNYWDKKFYDSIKELVSSTRNASLFDMHGWSGDNRKGNREVAGAYLVNRLTGSNKEKAFYGPTYKKKKVYIHLVGHSHGGNVMNEMTKQIYKLGKQWPDTWKVKSFTYLSTPFFQKLHQVKIGSFVHPQAEVLNAYNDYDYTQRMLADFSLFTLHEAVVVNQITETVKGNIEQFMAASKAVPWKLVNPKSNYWLDKDEGKKLYTATRNLLGATVANSMSAVKFLQSIEAIAVSLNKPVEYKVNQAIQANNKVTHSFKLLSDSNLANLKTVIAALTANINRSVEELDKGITKNTYSRAAFASAFLAGGLPLANNLSAFLNVPAGALNVAGAGAIWQTLVGVLSDAIEVFDDTVTKPDTQFHGSRPITPLDVTTRDKYHDSTQKANCIKLIAKLEALEKRVSAKPEANLLFDLVLILLVHDPKVRGIANMFNDWAGYIDWFEYAATGDVDVAAKALHATMTNLANALLSRFVGEIEDASDTHIPTEDNPKRGSLPYLLKESHSTSRRVLHTEVQEFLQRMMVN
jgi:hypothetical protein